MTTKPRGFAALTPQRRAEIAQSGGLAAHSQGKAHTWNSEAAKQASAKGLESRKAKRANGTIINK